MNALSGFCVCNRSRDARRGLKHKVPAERVALVDLNLIFETRFPVARPKRQQLRRSGLELESIRTRRIGTHHRHARSYDRARNGKTRHGIGHNSGNDGGARCLRAANARCQQRGRNQLNHNPVYGFHGIVRVKLVG